MKSLAGSGELRDMLLKFDSVEEIGRFAKLNHHAEPFSRLSLIFARNGYGKSTLCAILRSAAENQPNHITARRRLDAAKESRIQSTWAGAKTHAFSGGKWHSCPGKAYVFDEDFVRRNVHVGDSVTRENKRSLLPLVLGGEGVALSEKIVALDTEQRELDRSMKRDAAIIRAKCPVVTPDQVNAFCAKDVPDDVDEHVERAEKRLQLTKQTLAVQQKAKPRSIELPTLDQFREIASRTIDSVSQDVAKRVREHMLKHDLMEGGERWLRYGLEHLPVPTCPFCDQPIEGVDLIDAYQAFFSDAFNQLVSDRDSAIAALDTVIGDTRLEQLVRTNDTDFIFWSQVCDLPSQPTLTADEQQSIMEGLSALQAALGHKVANPLQPIGLGESVKEIEAAFATIATYNDAISGCCEVIAEAKAAAQAANVKAAQQVYDQWIAFAAKRSDPIKTAAFEYAKGDARRKAIEVEKEAAHNQLTNFADKLMKARQSEINDLLENFGANFSIVDAKANFKGRIPNTDYAIAVGNSRLEVGEASETEPSFKTVLSAGDKTTLALALFITQVRGDPNLSQAIIAFDDPFSSQDIHRQFETTSQIRSIAEVACQTLVFSHDPRFLHMIETDADPAFIRTFQVLCADDGTGAIKPWSSAEELKELYVRQGEMIREFAGQGKLLKDVDLTGLVQAIRPFLEDYIRARFPGRFDANTNLFPMIEAIEKAGHDDPLYGYVEDLKALNEYTRPNMHGGGKPPDSTALRAQCKRVMKVVGSY
jgi:wobble nucleotide-excising tRNase